ncbi:FAD-dependent oxidoreductase [Clostridium subterminale]|uniref:FAD-dependent oxidoreductase n=1 Tax=Clostridium subterminale TaxID=1550 RepID=A0ABN1KWR0_CLOSU
MNACNNSNSLYQIDNPSDCERYMMLEYILKMQNRLDDLNNIIDLMSPPKDITNICPIGYAKDIKVAIIGAGEAGLAAAFELRKIGCNITLFEASQRIGGRVYTYYFDRNNRYYGELGPMSIPVSHETTWHYINLFKLNTSPFVNNSTNAMFYVRGEKAVNDPKGKYISRNIYPRFHLTDSDRSKARSQLYRKFYQKYLDSLTSEERKELVETKPKYLKSIEDIDKLSYRRAYENAEFSEEAISMLGYLDGSQQFFKLSLTEILQQYYTADSECTYRINDGMINLPLSIYGALCDNTEIEDVYKGIDKDKLGHVDIKVGSPVDGIYNSSSGDKILLKYTECGTSKENLEEYDYVICAMPFPSLRRVEINPLFTVTKMQAINEMNYETAQKIYLYIKERFWEMGNASKRIVGGKSFTDLPLTSVYYPSDHAKPVYNKYGKWTLKPDVSPEEPGALLASYSWCQEAVRLGNENPELQVNDVIRYLEKMHELPPHYINENLIDYKSLIWSDVQYIWGAGALSKPQYKTLFSYAVTIPEMGNRVFFAGEHISQKHASQQGALQSGMISANEVAKQIIDNKE